jgi:hypothetical protein
MMHEGSGTVALKTKPPASRSLRDAGGDPPID